MSVPAKALSRGIFKRDKLRYDPWPWPVLAARTVAGKRHRCDSVIILFRSMAPAASRPPAPRAAVGTSRWPRRTQRVILRGSGDERGEGRGEREEEQEEEQIAVRLRATRSRVNLVPGRENSTGTKECARRRYLPADAPDNSRTLRPRARSRRITEFLSHGGESEDRRSGRISPRGRSSPSRIPSQEFAFPLRITPAVEISLALP